MTDISLNFLKHWTEILSVFRSKTLFLQSALSGPGTWDKKDLVQSANTEQYSDSPLFLQLTTSKPEYGINYHIQMALSDGGEIAVTNCQLGSLGDILTYPIDVDPNWSYPLHWMMNRPATSAASSPSPLTMKVSAARARNSPSICRNNHTISRRLQQGPPFLVLAYSDDYPYLCSWNSGRILAPKK